MLWLLAPALIGTCLFFANEAAAFEGAPSAHVSGILSPKLAQSIYHTVDKVEVDGKFYRFHIQSEYGQYDVPSMALLRIRVREIKTLGEAISEFARADNELSEQLHGQLSVRANSAIDIISRPVSTATSLAGQLAHNLDQTLSGRRDTVRRDLPADYVGMEYSADPVLSMHRRNVAAQWGLDVYSTNPQVQEFLNEVAQARSAGRISAGTPALVSHAADRLSDATIEARVAMELKSRSRDELAASNRALLNTMGIPERVSRAFLANAFYSPSHRIRLLHYLAALEGVRDRAAFLEAARDVDSERLELAFEQAAMILVRYQKRVDKLEKIHAGPQVLQALTRDRRIVYIVPVDIIYWSQPTADLFGNLSREAGNAGFKGWELVTAGDVTPMAKAELKDLGFTVRDDFAD